MPALAIENLPVPVFPLGNSAPTDIATSKRLGFLLVAAAVVVSFFWLGRLSPTEKEQRTFYARFVGHPVDPARLRDDHAEFTRRIRDLLDRRAQVIGLPSSAASGPADHAALALNPKVVDRDYLRAAFVLARLQWADARGEERRMRAAQHAAIWAKLEGPTATPARGGNARTAATDAR